MITLADLRPGDIGFARHVSPRSADLLILAGQTFLGEPGYPHHVFVVTQAQTNLTFGMDLGGPTFGPKIVQAMPSGAEEITVGQEHWTADYTYIRPAYEHNGPARPFWVRDEPTQAVAVAVAARDYVGTPYSFADYAAITGLHLGIKNGPIRRYVTSSRHMICSQLADQAMSDAGWHVFNDKRLPQDVTPGALFAQMMTMPGLNVTPGQDWVDNLWRG